jgi:hypothetical protein
MDPERWRRVTQIYDLAVERPASERAAFVANATGGDVSLRREVEDLLAHDEFPEAGHRTLISTSGGTRPLWARNGQELFYRTLTGGLMRAGIDHTSALAATAPVQLFEGRYVGGVNDANVGRTYDVSSDGGRFLMIKESAPATSETTPPHLVVVQNRSEELKRRVPAQ